MFVIDWIKLNCNNIRMFHITGRALSLAGKWIGVVSHTRRLNLKLRVLCSVCAPVRGKINWASTQANANDCKDKDNCPLWGSSEQLQMPRPPMVLLQVVICHIQHTCNNYDPTAHALHIHMPYNCYKHIHTCKLGCLGPIAIGYCIVHLASHDIPPNPSKAS